MNVIRDRMNFNVLDNGLIHYLNNLIKCINKLQRITMFLNLYCLNSHKYNICLIY